MVLAALGQRGLRVAGDSHGGTADLVQRGQQAHDLVALAAVAHKDNYVILRHHAEIAVHSFAGVHEKRRRAETGQRRCNLCADVTGFSHAGDDDLSRAVHHQPDDVLKVLAKALFRRLQGRDLRVKYPLCFFYDVHIRSPYVPRYRPESVFSAASPFRPAAPCWGRQTWRDPGRDASP